jgi:hypothetical protein
LRDPVRNRLQVDEFVGTMHVAAGGEPDANSGDPRGDGYIGVGA